MFSIFLKRRLLHAIFRMNKIGVMALRNCILVSKGSAYLADTGVPTVLTTTVIVRLVLEMGMAPLSNLQVGRAVDQGDDT